MDYEKAEHFCRKLLEDRVQKIFTQTMSSDERTVTAHPPSGNDTVPMVAVDDESFAEDVPHQGVRLYIDCIGDI